MRRFYQHVRSPALLYLISFFIFAPAASAQSSSESSPALHPLQDQSSNTLPEALASQCDNAITYDFFYRGSHIGQGTRSTQWQDNQASVTTEGKISVLVFKNKGKQVTNIRWSEDQQQFLPTQFIRDIDGFSDAYVRATFSQDNLSSEVNLDGEKKYYKQESVPITDMDAIALQIQRNLQQGVSAFDFKMQRAEKVSHYYFQVRGQETVKIGNKQYQAWAVEQIKKKDRKLVMWFAPELEWQMVQAHYKRRILDITATAVNYQSACLAQPVNFAAK
ncbi:DUF3108 domain-containing protein [Motilimonas pumila]|uniref:DUF3108 domain-containing protein n=1 Tax=Motilimonas pumila TaxID=2303987 RepID=UPI001314C92C|nr:DUF3108 domain-containing protein [Motilimonas pumila]